MRGRDGDKQHEQKRQRQVLLIVAKPVLETIGSLVWILRRTCELEQAVR